MPASLHMDGFVATKENMEIIFQIIFAILSSSWTWDLLLAKPLP